MGEHLLGMVARGLGLDHGGRARRVEAGEQHRRFDLRRGDRRAIDDRRRIARALEHDRAAPAFGLGENLRAHQPERIEDAPHRPLAQRGVAVESRGDGVAADDAHHQPGAGAGIAEIERFARRRQRAEPGPRTRHRPGAEPLDLGAERLARLAGAQHVVAFEQAVDFRVAAGQQAEEKGAMRDRFVARRADAPFQRSRALALSGDAAEGCDGRADTKDLPCRELRPREAAAARARSTAARRLSTRRTKRIDTELCGRLTGALLNAGLTYRELIAVAKPELGTKRQCQNCGAKFFDLNKDPIVCPKCGTVFQGAAARARAAAKEAEEEEEPRSHAAGVEMVSLDEAEASEKAAEPWTTISRSRTTSRGAEDTFLEEEEEDEDDVTALIDGDIAPTRSPEQGGNSADLSQSGWRARGFFNRRPLWRREFAVIPPPSESKARLRPNRSAMFWKNGAIAQLGERFNGIEEVVGSIPSGSTKPFNKLSECLSRSCVCIRSKIATSSPPRSKNGLWISSPNRRAQSLF